MYYPLRFPTFSEENLIVSMCLPWVSQFSHDWMIISPQHYNHSCPISCFILWIFSSPTAPPSSILRNCVLILHSLGHLPSIPCALGSQPLNQGHRWSKQTNQKPCQAEQPGPGQVPSALPVEVGVQCPEIQDIPTQTEMQPSHLSCKIHVKFLCINTKSSFSFPLKSHLLNPLPQDVPLKPGALQQPWHITLLQDVAHVEDCSNGLGWKASTTALLEMLEFFLFTPK